MNALVDIFLTCKSTKKQPIGKKENIHDASNYCG